jgi:hypothetical protein
VEGERVTFRATFRAWDSGAYRVSVANPCSTLTLPGATPRPYANVKHIAEVAAWGLTVLDSPYKVAKMDTARQNAAGSPEARLGVFQKISALPGSQALGSGPALVFAEALRGSTGAPESAGAGAEAQGQAGFRAGEGLRTEEERAEEEQALREAEAAPGVTPCQETLKSRWVRGARGIEWMPFPCAGMSRLHDWHGTLWARGVREVLFVGDSHLRLLLLHSVFLLTGERPPMLLLCVVCAQACLMAGDDAERPWPHLPGNSKTFKAAALWPQGRHAGAT